MANDTFAARSTLRVGGVRQRPHPVRLLRAPLSLAEGGGKGASAMRPYGASVLRQAQDAEAEAARIMLSLSKHAADR